LIRLSYFSPPLGTSAATKGGKAILEMCSDRQL
jgi:hypothetical protein